MDAIEKLQVIGQSFEDIYRNGAKITVRIPIGYLRHEPTQCNISVYSPIGWFKRLMLKWCFGLEYKPIK